jgi:hypothetical protein
MVTLTNLTLTFVKFYPQITAETVSSNRPQVRVFVRVRPAAARLAGHARVAPEGDRPPLGDERQQVTDSVPFSCWIVRDQIFFLTHVKAYLVETTEAHS